MTTEETAGRAPATPRWADPFAALDAVELRPMPDGAMVAVMAVCRDHPGEVKCLGVVGDPGGTGAGSLALMVAEHLAAEHDGPPVCSCDGAVNAACPEHGTIAQALEEAESYRITVRRLAQTMGIDPDADTPPAGEVVEAMLKALEQATRIHDGLAALHRRSRLEQRNAGVLEDGVTA